MFQSASWKDRINVEKQSKMESKTEKQLLEMVQARPSEGRRRRIGGGIWDQWSLCGQGDPAEVGIGYIEHLSGKD